MKDAANRLERAGRRQPLLWETRVHPHIHAEDADIWPAFALCAIDLRVSDAHSRFSLLDIWALRGTGGFIAGQHRWRIASDERFQRIAQADGGVRRQTHEAPQFNDLAVHRTDLNQPIGL